MSHHLDPRSYRLFQRNLQNQLELNNMADEGSKIKGVTFLPYLIIIPLSIYGIIWFKWKTSDETVATKRSLFLSYGLSISLSFGILMSFCAHGSIFYISQEVTNNALLSAVILSYLFSWYLILYFLIIKSWKLHYKYKFSFYSLQLKWQQLINSNIVETSQKTNWYIHNNHKYGNLKYIIKRGAIFAGLGYIWFIVYFITDLIPLLAIGFFCTLLFIVFYIIIICKTPYQKDTYFFHWESQTHSRLLSLCFLILVIMAMAFSFTHDIPHPYIIVGCIHTFISSVFCGMILVATYGVVRKNTTNLITRHTKSTHHQGNNNKYTVELLLSNKKSANAFMKYLAKELCTY